MERFPLFRGRKCSFRGIPSSAEEPIPKLGMEWKGTEFREKINFNGTVQYKYWTKYLLTRVVETNSYGIYKNFQFEYCRRLALQRFVLSCFLFCGMVRNGIRSCFLFRWKVRKGIPRVCFYYCSTELNSELFSLPLKGSEGNSERLLLFLFCGTEFRDVFSSAEGFGTEFRDFLFRGTAGIPSEITVCSVTSVFRGIIFLSEIPKPSGD